MSRKPAKKKSIPAASTIADKKAAILGTDIAGRPRWLPILLVAALIGGGGAFWLLQSPPGTTLAPAAAVAPAAPPPAAGTANPAEISYPLAAFDDGQARHFDHSADGRTIRYFIVKSSDGVVRAAFDACDVCWPAGKGYAQQGGVMICRNCGQQFATHLVNEVQGGCNPAPLSRRVEGDRLIIRLDDVREGGKYFDSKGKA